MSTQPPNPLALALTQPSPDLRPYQEEAIRQVAARIAAGLHRLLLVAPTGAGKTVLARAVIRALVGLSLRCLFLAHRKELIDQASAKLDAVGIDHGVIMADHPRCRPEALVQVASVQTLARREKPPADLVICDECHHARAGTYQDIFDHYPDATFLGLTATPWRADGKGLAELFDDLVLVATPAQLIQDGYLVPFDGFSFEQPDLSRVRTRGEDYDEGQLEDVMNTSRIVGGIVERWLAHAKGWRTVVFAVSIRHSQAIVAQFRKAGVPAEHLDGSLPKAEREAILARLARGETQVVSNCAVLTEGWDLPECACCILARPTQSLSLYLQQVGRVLRPAPGKTHARIHDHAGCLMRHGLPDAERDYRLTADTAQEGPAAAVVQTCPVCFQVYPASARHCPTCGPQEAPPADGVPPAAEGRLVTIARLRELERLQSLPARLLALKGAEYLRLQEVARRKGYRPGWAYHRYRETLHEEPRFPPGFLERCVPASRPFHPRDAHALTWGGIAP